MTKCETAICQLAVNVYGKTSQCTVCMEEMAELTKELSKNLRGQDNAAHIAEGSLMLKSCWNSSSSCLASVMR